MAFSQYVCDHLICSIRQEKKEQEENLKRRKDTKIITNSSYTHKLITTHLFHQLFFCIFFLLFFSLLPFCEFFFLVRSFRDNSVLALHQFCGVIFYFCSFFLFSVHLFSRDSRIISCVTEITDF